MCNILTMYSRTFYPLYIPDALKNSILVASRPEIRPTQTLADRRRPMVAPGNLRNIRDDPPQGAGDRYFHVHDTTEAPRLHLFISSLARHAQSHPAFAISSDSMIMRCNYASLEPENIVIAKVLRSLPLALLLEYPHPPSSKLSFPPL